MNFPLRGVLLACTAALACVCALAKTAWPDKPVRFYVENKAGASGTTGSDLVAKAAPDGAAAGIDLFSHLRPSPN